MTGTRYQQPRSFLTSKGEWPTGPFAKGTPPYAHRTAALVANLATVMAADGRSQRQLAAAAGLNPATLSRMLAGMTVPDVGTLAALEHTLDTDLWPGRS